MKPIVVFDTNILISVIGWKGIPNRCLDLAKTALLEVHNIRSQQNLSQEGKKRIKYGTRALLLPSGDTKG